MSINLHLLRLFTAVVEHDGVVSASRALRLSQPAVSRAVHQLEAELGVALLERQSRRVRLTPEGRDIYAQARGVFAAERGVEETVAALKGLRHGVLHIGASTTIGTYVLPAIIGEFSRRHPHVELRLSAVHTRVIVEMLKEYQLDIALAEAPVDDRAVESTPWRLDEMLVVAAPGHPLSNRPVQPAELSNELFVLREPESGTRSIVLEALRRAGVEVRRSMAIDGTEVIKQVVAGGLGIAIVSGFAVAEQLASGRLVSLDVRGLHVQRPFNRLSIPGRRPTYAAEAFLGLLEAEVRGDTSASSGPG